MPVRSLSWEEIKARIEERSLHVYLADVGGGEVYHRVEYQVPLALVIGGEASGASAYARSLADQLVQIPMSREIESLNTATAAAILLFEINRQRQK